MNPTANAAGSPSPSSATSRPFRGGQWIDLFLRLLLGGVFVYAGALKAWNPALFLMDIRSFDLLGDPWAAVLALVLPWVEILAGAAVIAGRRGYGGALLLVQAALLAFLAAILVSWARGLDITCGCFGAAENRTSYPELVARDVLLLAIGGWLLFRHFGRSRAASGLRAPGDAGTSLSGEAASAQSSSASTS